ncbi:MAG: type IX secretion system protein PorQ [Muribaculaceae bacterium]|nr:type IX secretion system protein PorQ [Muribaculaceae bacterium]
MNLRKLISGILLTAAGIAMSAQDGSIAYEFLNTTSSTRIYGLGGINITTIDGFLGSADQNPGLLGGEMDNQLLVNYMRYLGDSNFAGIRYSRAAGEYGAWAVGIQYYGYGAIKGADENGILTGEFSPKDVSFSGTYAHDITDRLRGGATLKMIYSGYEQYSAFAVATDLGINYYDEERDLSLSFVAANLGGQVKRFRDRYDRLPFDLRLGWSQSFGTLPIRFSVTAWNLTKWHLPYYDPGDGTAQTEPTEKDSFSSNLFRHLIFGADFTPSDKFYVTLAYNYKTRTDMSTYSRSFLSGFSLGAGLNVDKFGIGLAFAQPHTGATTFMVNLRLDINDFIY